MSAADFLLTAVKTPVTKEMGDNIYVWLAIILATGAIFKQGYDALSKRRKTRDSIEEALDKQPLIRDQLSLGNWGEAIEQLNAIIKSQAEHIKRQDDDLKAARDRNEHLEDRTDTLEKDYDRLEVAKDNLEAEVIRLRLRVGDLPTEEGS